MAVHPVASADAALSVRVGRRGAGLTVANGLEALFDARLIKSAEELKLIELSASLVDGVYAQLAHFIRPGVKENEVVAEISHWLIAHGAERITGINCVSGPRSNPHPPDYSDRMIRPGDLVFIDIMSHYLGYATCYYRTFAVPTASQRQTDIYKRSNEWLEARIDRIKPGAQPADHAMASTSAATLTDSAGPDARARGVAAVMRAPRPIAGGMIVPRIGSVAWGRAAKARREPNVIIRGIVNWPTVTTLATPEPEIVPIMPEANTATLAGPPRVRPNRPSETSVNSWIMPARSRNEPNRMNRKM